MFAALRPTIVPVPPAHHRHATGRRRRLVVEDLLAGLRGTGLRLA